MSDDVQLDPTAVQWSVPTAERAGRPVVVLLHGLGADEHDLFSLVPHLPDGFVYAAVRAPLTPPWPMGGASWYAIGDPLATAAPEVTAAAAAVLRWLEHEGIAEAGLLGFSQGGAVALQAMRLQRAAVSFVVCLGGYAAPGELPGDEALRREPRPVFWGRGSADTVIVPARIAHTTTWLPQHSDLSGGLYAGLGHAISREELDDVVTFLGKREAEHAA